MLFSNVAGPDYSYFQAIGWHHVTWVCGVLLPGRRLLAGSDQRIVSVPVDHYWLRQWPFNAERRIVPAHTASVLRRVEFGHVIDNFGVVAQGLKAVRATRRDVEHQI